MNINSLLISYNSSLKDCLRKLNKVGSKSLIVIEPGQKIKGVISDGDIRKNLLKGYKLSKTIKQIYNKNPIYFFKNKYDEKKLKKIFSRNKIDIIPIVDQNLKVIKIYQWDYFFKDSKNKNFSLPVVIMAGGKGKRMRPFTEVLPKPLLPFSGKTVIEKIIDNFIKFNFKNINVIINYKTDILKSFLNNIQPKIKIVEEKKYLGTIGGLKLLKNKNHKNLIISNCDTICDLDLENLLNFHKKKDNYLTAVVSNKKFNIPYGSCVTDANGQLLKIEEKPKIDIFSLTGIYVIKTKSLNSIPKNTYYDVNNLINTLLQNKKKVGVFPIDEKKWTDVGEWKFYLENLNKKI